MSDRLQQAAMLAMLVLGFGGCGGSSSHATSNTSSSPASTAASLTATTTTPAQRKHPANKTTSTTSTTSTASTVATAPPPTPSGTPAPPGGLRPAVGYGTYELCASGCSGAVPSSLRRPLHLPAGSGCPASAGGGPVRPEGSASLMLMPFIGSSWRGARVIWTAATSYGGPVLIRGRQLGGSGAVGFGEGHTPYDELQLLASGTGAPPATGGGRSWLSFTRVPGPGCYAYQIDGTSFSSVIVFRAI